MAAKTDMEILEELRKHTTEELIAFRNKLRKIPDNGQAWVIRFFILRVLASRSFYFEPDASYRYSLSIENDPTSFYEPRDDGWYHLCDYPGHHHYVRFPWPNCYGDTVTWEARYAR